MKLKHVPLYETFGKFMGQEAPEGSENREQLAAIAQEHSLKARFINASKIKGTLPADHRRLNVITNDENNRIMEIAIG